MHNAKKEVILALKFNFEEAISTAPSVDFDDNNYILVRAPNILQGYTDYFLLS